MSTGQDFSEDITNGGFSSDMGMQNHGGDEEMQQSTTEEAEGAMNEDSMAGQTPAGNGEAMDSTVDTGSADQYGKDDDRKLFIGGLRGFAFIVFSEVATLDKVIAAGEHVINGKKVDPKKAKARHGKIFVGGLTAEISDDDIKTYFAQFGNVVEIEMPIDKSKNQRKGFCFITFDNEQIVHELLKTPKQVIGGKEVDVKKAQPPQNARMTMPWGGPMGMPVGRGARGAVRGGSRGRGRGDWSWGGGGGYGAAGGYASYGGGYGQNYGPGAAAARFYDYGSYGGSYGGYNTYADGADYADYGYGYGYESGPPIRGSSGGGGGRGRGGFSGKTRGAPRGGPRHMPY